VKKHGPTSDTAHETLSVRYAELLLLRREVERLETGRYHDGSSTSQNGLLLCPIKFLI
jgi:hypothetical protein